MADLAQLLQEQQKQAELMRQITGGLPGLNRAREQAAQLQNQPMAPTGMLAPQDAAPFGEMPRDPTDLTNKYNTQLSPEETQKYQAWLQTLAPNQRNTYDYDMQGAFKAGVGQSENGHLPDTFKKPNHPTFSDQSKYSGQEGYVGGKWEKLPSGQWSFTQGVSSTRKPMIDREDLKRYFAKQEAGNVLKVE